MAGSTSLRHRAAWLVCGAGFVVLVIYLSVTPSPLQVPSVGNFKTGHIVAYLWTMLWFAQIYRGAAPRLAIAALLCALGIGLEYVQLWLGYRDFSYSDMVDDAIGVGLGLFLALTPLGRALDAIDRRWPVRA